MPILTMFKDNILTTTISTNAERTEMCDKKSDISDDSRNLCSCDCHQDDLIQRLLTKVAVLESEVRLLKESKPITNAIGKRV